MGIIQKIQDWANPEKQLKKEIERTKLQAFREIKNSGYSNYGASLGKKSLRGWITDGGSSKEDIEENLDTLRQRSRDLYMGVPLATGAIKTCRTNIVGGGLKLKSQIDYKTIGITQEEAREKEMAIEKEFAIWAETNSCDIERVDNFYELQQLAFSNWLMSGDVIVLLPKTKRVGEPYDLRVQLIEADRVSTPIGKEADPNIIDGVEINDKGEIIAYYISNIHPHSQNFEQTQSWTRVDAYGKKTGRRNVLQIMNRERIGQKRGVPFLAPVIEALKQLGRYTDAELVAAVVSGYLTIFIEKPDPYTSEPPFGEMIPPSQQVDRDTQNSIELAPGAIVDLQGGEKPNVVNPGRPNENFSGFVEAICRQIGAALEIPYELLTKNFQASYSASRGALLEAWKMFRMYREWLSHDFCQPIYEEWMTEAVAKGRIEAPGFFNDPAIKKAYCDAEWNGPAQGMLNPVQEVNAAAKRVDNGFSTRSKESKEMNGTDFYKNVQELQREEEAMKTVPWAKEYIRKRPEEEEVTPNDRKK